MSLLDRVEIARKTMVLFFVLDTSGSMSGTKIGALNDSIRETLPDLRGLSTDNPDASIKIAILKFDSDVQWLYPEPVDSEDFQWNDLNVGGVTSLGLALKELNNKLSKNSFLKEAAGSYAPVIIFHSDGAPTDDYQSALKEIMQNNWYKHAIKVAVAHGDDANVSVLTELTGHSETVLRAHNTDDLKKIIRFVSVTSSQINSKSTGVSDSSKQQQVVDALGKFKDNDYQDTGSIDDVDEDEFD